MGLVILASTFPDRDELESLAEALVRGRIAACVNIMQVSSIYSWDDTMHKDAEYLALFKTAKKNRDALRDAILNAHPYDTPEVAEIDVASVNEPYLKWVLDSVMPPPA